MHKILTAALTALALLLPLSLSAPAAGAADAEAGSRITGTWEGDVFGDAGAEAGYGAKVRISKRDGRLRGKVNAGGCIGVWRFKGTSNGWYKFTEIITRDANGLGCVERVQVKVRRDGRKLRVVWREPTSGDTATMLARRA